MSSTRSKTHSHPTIIERSQHAISRQHISESALKVLYRLKNHGHQAFLVGGAVRDLLLGLRPKDFDVATDATPEQVRALFRNCRLIGRRFRLAHVRFGREIIEVATFRGNNNHANQHNHIGEQLKDAQGRILRDNVYGRIEDDVWRRDFTVNALYYNIADFTIWDYVGGCQDIEKRSIRLIGDPVERYREDPVRMLRAVRFAAKLGFEISADARKPLSKLGGLLANVPPARLADESFKLFLSGSASQTFEQLLKHGLFGLLYPQTQDFLNEHEQADHVDKLLSLFRVATKNTDVRIASEKPVTPAFLNAVFLWPVVERRTDRYQDEGKGAIQSAILASEEVVAEQQRAVSIPRRLVMPIKEILVMQYRLRYRRGMRALRLAAHPRFRAAYDVLLLRAQCKLEHDELAAWWTDFQKMTEAEQRKITGVKPNKNKSVRSSRRRRSRKRRSQS